MADKKPLRRPTKAQIKRITDFLAENGISMYTVCANLDTGAVYGSNMDISTAEEVIKIYNHNDKDTWFDTRTEYDS